eukprot:TRINITY_DN37427_c0_g1_i2.p1 TRINITY_DN37427_c0_g1~~TRINITY_DN37427_c0_g1_i2.p1  ORF type:complete len:487 (-),score=111.63 TRINITY_DN37427_c0_g1_i2:82-1542(-)
MAPAPRGRDASSDGKTARRTRSGSRRRKIIADLQAKQQNAKEAFELQKQLIGPGVTEVLMKAAKQFLQPEHYEAVVEERANEGLCGYPLCCNNCPPPPEGKRWSVSFSERKVYKTEEVARFCSVECRRASTGFRLGLEPEPAYIRPASAVASTRAAIAEATEAKKQALVDSEKKKESAEQKPIPKVRPRAVVKFSRETGQTYSVRYDEYDGSGSLPDVVSVPSTKPAAPVAISKEGVKEMLKAPVLERNCSSPAPEADKEKSEEMKSDFPIRPEESEDQSKDVAKAVPSKTVRFAPPERVEKEEEADEEKEEDQVADLFDGASSVDDEDGFFDESEKPSSQSVLSFVRVWGVLSSLLTHNATDFLKGGEPLRLDEERYPAHKGRRNLLQQLLGERLPPDLSFLSARFFDLVGCLGVHQTLPCVTETRLYDLLGALLISGLLKGDVARGLIEVESSQMNLIDKKVKDASKAFGLTDSELMMLQEMIP